MSESKFLRHGMEIYIYMPLPSISDIKAQVSLSFVLISTMLFGFQYLQPTAFQEFQLVIFVECLAYYIPTVVI